MAAEQAQLYQKMAEVSAGMPAELRAQMMTNLHARMVKLPGTEGVKLANTITILGEDREISRDDFYGRVSSPKLVWPQNAELALHGDTVGLDLPAAVICTVIRDEECVSHDNLIYA